MFMPPLSSSGSSWEKVTICQGLWSAEEQGARLECSTHVRDSVVVNLGSNSWSEAA